MPNFESCKNVVSALSLKLRACYDLLPLLIEIIDGNCLQISEPLRNFLILVGLLLKDASCSSILGEMIQFDQIQFSRLGAAQLWEGLGGHDI